MSEIHPDRNSYEVIWTEIIEKEIKKYIKKYDNFIEIIPNAKELIWERYVYLNNYCKTNYMKLVDGKIDRHKVASCYLISISSVKPICFMAKTEDVKDDMYCIINERLAITVALSVLRAFIMSAIKNSTDYNENEKSELKKKFDKGLKYPRENLINHGNYITNYASEIYYSQAEGNINILAIAHELYLLEVFTRIYDE